MIYVVVGVYVVYTYVSYLVVCWCPQRGTSSIDWVQLVMFLREDGDRIKSPERCVLNKTRTLDDIQKHCAKPTTQHNATGYSNDMKWPKIVSETLKEGLVGTLKLTLILHLKIIFLKTP
jgi:hypothetical protein